MLSAHRTRILSFAFLACAVARLAMQNVAVSASTADLMDVWTQYLMNYRQKIEDGLSPSFIFRKGDSTTNAPSYVRSSSSRVSMRPAAAAPSAISSIGDAGSIGIGLFASSQRSYQISSVSDTASVGTELSSAAQSSSQFSSLGDTTSVGIGRTSSSRSSAASSAVTHTGPLAVTIYDGVATVAPGQMAYYRVSVQNNTALPIDDVVVRGPLSPHLLFVAATANGYSPNPQMVRWDIGRLAAGEKREMLVRAIVRPTVPQGMIVATGMQAQRGMESPLDVHAVNDLNTIAGTQPAVPLIDLAMADGVETLVPGASVAYRLDVHNFTGVPLSMVTVRGPVPQLLSHIHADNGGVVLPSGVLEWSIGTMQAGEARTLTFEGTVGASATQGSQIAAVFQVELKGVVLDIARDSNTVKKTSSVMSYVCGNGICEDAEKLLICPPCMPDSPPEQCACSMRCTVDCADDSSSDDDEIAFLMAKLSSPDPTVRLSASQHLQALYNDALRDRLIAAVDASELSVVRMEILRLLLQDIQRTDVLFAYVRALERETDSASMIILMNKISNGVALNVDLRVDDIRQISGLLRNIAATHGDATVRSVANQRRGYIESFIVMRFGGGDGGQSGTGGSNGNTGGVNGGSDGGTGGGSTCGNAKCDVSETQATCPQDCILQPLVCGDGVCSSPRETGANCARDCFPYRYNKCVEPVLHATNQDACNECLVLECTKDAHKGRERCIEACITYSCGDGVCNIPHENDASCVADCAGEKVHLQ